MVCSCALWYRQLWMHSWTRLLAVTQVRCYIQIHVSASQCCCQIIWHLCKHMAELPSVRACHAEILHECQLCCIYEAVFRNHDTDVHMLHCVSARRLCDTAAVLKSFHEAQEAMVRRYNSFSVTRPDEVADHYTGIALCEVRPPSIFSGCQAHICCCLDMRSA